jgi:hypothetical protein
VGLAGRGGKRGGEAKPKEREGGKQGIWPNIKEKGFPFMI